MTWMFNDLFNTISVMSGRWEANYEGLCEKKCRLDSGRISLPAGLKPAEALTARPCGHFLK